MCRGKAQDRPCGCRRAVDPPEAPWSRAKTNSGPPGGGRGRRGPGHNSGSGLPREVIFQVRPEAFSRRFSGELRKRLGQGG